MRNRKKNLFVIALLLVTLSLTSYYFIGLKPKTSKYSKAKLVYDYIIEDQWKSETHE